MWSLFLIPIIFHCNLLIINRKLKNHKIHAKTYSNSICRLIKRTYICSPTGWYHSSVGRAKDWKSLCRWFDSSWYHEKTSEKSGVLLLYRYFTANISLLFKVSMWALNIRFKVEFGVQFGAVLNQAFISKTQISIFCQVQMI